jgi:peptidoglycan/LPS O-acetylase OafA/YrhL
VRAAPSHEIASYLFIAALVLFTIGFAYAMHQLVEVPALRWARYLKPSVTQSTSSRRA